MRLFFASFKQSSILLSIPDLLLEKQLLTIDKQLLPKEMTKAPFFSLLKEQKLLFQAKAEFRQQQAALLLHYLQGSLGKFEELSTRQIEDESPFGSWKVEKGLLSAPSPSRKVVQKVVASVECARLARTHKRAHLLSESKRLGIVTIEGGDSSISMININDQSVPRKDL